MYFMFTCILYEEESTAAVSLRRLFSFIQQQTDFVAHEIVNALPSIRGIESLQSDFSLRIVIEASLGCLLLDYVTFRLICSTIHNPQPSSSEKPISQNYFYKFHLCIAIALTFALDFVYANKKPWEHDFFLPSKF